MRQMVATRHRDKLLQQISTCNMWKSLSICDRILSLRSVARIQTGLNSCDISQRQIKISASSLISACVRICDKSLRQNLNQPIKGRQLASRHDKFVLYISSLPKSIACTEETYRCDLSQHQYRRGDLSPRCVRQRFIASCVSAFRRWLSQSASTGF